MTASLATTVFDAAALGGADRASQAPHVALAQDPTCSAAWGAPSEEEERAEEWRSIPGFPRYEVSSFGRVRSWAKKGPGSKLLDQPRLLVQARKRNGYMQIRFRTECGAASYHGVHRLVLLAFVGPCPAQQETRHLNGVRYDNRLSNLRYGTKAENAADKKVHGTEVVGDRHWTRTHPEMLRRGPKPEIRGSRNGRSKLSPHDVLAIRASTLGCVALSERYGVTSAVICNIRARRIWSWLEAV